jgi:hypothetical protein
MGASHESGAGPDWGDYEARRLAEGILYFDPGNAEVLIGMPTTRAGWPGSP